jgi:carbonic anhydrase/acetyltransferase-like protein (isoleucine patch superfamily)
MAYIQKVRGIAPQIGENCFLAVNAVVAGDVVLAEGCSVWFNAVLRGDVGPIRIGRGSNIQDGVVVHATYQQSETIIGEQVSVGHGAILHGCRVNDGALIGMGAVVMDHAVVGQGAVVAAGAVVLAGTQIPPGTLFAGVPAKQVKEVSAEMQAKLLRTASRYQEYASWFEEQ